MKVHMDKYFYKMYEHFTTLKSSKKLIIIFNNDGTAIDTRVTEIQTNTIGRETKGKNRRRAREGRGMIVHTGGKKRQH